MVKMQWGIGPGKGRGYRDQPRDLRESLGNLRKFLSEKYGVSLEDELKKDVMGTRRYVRRKRHDPMALVDRPYKFRRMDRR